MKRRTPIRRVSPKQSKLLRQYAKQRKAFLEAHPWCEVCTEPGDRRARATDIHHKKGRGKYLLDESTWLAVSREGHRWIHDHPKQAAELGYILPR